MPLLRSFVSSADAESPFPLNNLPYGVRRVGAGGHVVVAIGDRVLDLAELAAQAPGMLDDALDGAVGRDVFASGSLNAFLKLGRRVWRKTRAVLQDALSESPVSFPRLRDDERLQASVLLAAGAVDMVLPVEVGDYTDFYSCRQHATNVGTMFRGKEKALLENWTSLPVAYHGRASSVVASGTPIRRPCGQLKPAEGAATFGACRLLDFELEMAAVIGGEGNALGERVAVGDAGNHVFGLALMNDWSARDIQKWEYVPLGPFGAKNFGTTIGHWVVPMEALEPFLIVAPPQDPPVLDYLCDRSGGMAHRLTYGIRLSVGIAAAGESKAETVCKTSFQNVYWSVAQQVAHHTVTGCNLRAGDLLASGTISGDDERSLGSMLELSWKGSRLVKLGESGKTRKFLLDGDTVHLNGVCEGDGFRVGFGPCVGTVLPAQL